MLKFEEKFQHPNLVHLTVMLVLALPFLTGMVNFLSTWLYACHV